MGQRPSFDMSKLTTADRILVGASGLFLIWSFVPVWYSVDFDPALGSHSIGGWTGVTTVAAVMSILALAWVGMRIAGVSLNLTIKPGTVDLGLAGIALLFTLLGLVVQPALYGVSWGLIVALLLAVAWTYGGYMKYSEPEMVARPPAFGGTEPPAPPTGP
jgi:ascorbate-specific PTS system EIIC-type component UlaA